MEGLWPAQVSGGVVFARPVMASSGVNGLMVKDLASMGQLEINLMLSLDMP